MLTHPEPKVRGLLRSKQSVSRKQHSAARKMNALFHPTNAAIMIRSFAILAAILWTGTAGQGQSTTSEIHFRATVQSVSPLEGFSGTITPVEFDSRFALTLRIESAAPAVADFRTCAVVTLGIHSPILLFVGETPKAKTWDFNLHREVEDGRVRYSGLTARKVPQHTSRTGR